MTRARRLWVGVLAILLAFGVVGLLATPSGAARTRDAATICNYDEVSSSALPACDASLADAGANAVLLAPIEAVPGLIWRSTENSAVDSMRRLATNSVGGLSDDVPRLAESNITGSGETVLGHYADDYVGLVQTRGASYFDIGDAYNGLSGPQ
jgi:hypothetical protein